MRTCDERRSIGDEAENELFESFRASHLPWNLQFDPAVPPTHARVDLGEPWVVGCTVGWMSGRRRARELRQLLLTFLRWGRGDLAGAGDESDCV